MTTLDSHLKAEADEFNKRIEDRTRAGYIPDIRRAVKCDYFYKSFWRDPHFVNLFLGRTVAALQDMLHKHRGRSLRMLDVGCGAGYISLEFARAGHHVLGIDISDSCITAAKKCAAENPFVDGFGSLRYEVSTIEQVSGTFDCILYSGVLHHLEDPGAFIKQGVDLLAPSGVVMCDEVCHDRWRPQDAAQVALLRSLLAVTGHWYEPNLGAEVSAGDKQLATYIDEVMFEYANEQDRSEGGQSPNDNSSNGQQILDALRAQTQELEHRDGASFIYRFLGGLRGPDALVRKMADLIALYERHAVASGYLQPNHFFFIGKKRA